MSVDLTDVLKREYLSDFITCVINPKNINNVNYSADKIIANKSRYEKIEIVPWAIVGVIHGLECSFNFNLHLHNGDPLTARTVHVPSGRPVEGKPPFTWEYSAKDALHDRVLPHAWDIPNMLYFLEGYNGFGYRQYHNNETKSPYLWSMTNKYTKGKYAADGKFDPNLVSKQAGAVAILKALTQKGQKI